jgi:hypothetical protein
MWRFGFFLLLIHVEAFGQQHIIANKDRTRPEINESLYQPAFITSLGIKRMNGYNEISWTALREYDTRKYVVEYSLDGIDFLAAGETVANAGTYRFNHSYLDGHLFDDPPVLYRIRAEQFNNQSYYSESVMLEGDAFSPVKIFPTIIEGNELRIQADWPVEKILVVNSSGQLVFSKDVGGLRDFMTVTVPAFGKGIYFITFHGRHWKTTSRFIVP